jgi:predicted esterase YcpF (UPF0227 family)
MNSHTPYTVIYLHGFLSSPQSVKAMQTQAFFAKHYPTIDFVVPSIDHYPDRAIIQLKALVAQYQQTKLRFVGSSMGGFFSTHLVNQFGGKAVLINPAVMPHVLLNDYLGEHENPYTKNTFLLEHKHIDVLERLFVRDLNNLENFWVLLQTADEALDYQQAVDRYLGARVTIEEGGDHSFVGYERYLKGIAEFLLEE